MHVESAGGFVLLACTVIALVFANSGWSQSFLDFWDVPIAVSFGQFQFSHSLGHWINDGLMTVFFFVVGLEIKREVVFGELKDRGAAILPAMAAAGGMVVPALVYHLSISGQPGGNGWGIPMATDIAFVVGFLSLLGKRIPHGLKILVLSLAIVDDLGAILVIAAVYSSEISVVALTAGFFGIGVTALLNRLGVRQVPVYAFVGVLIWMAFLASGIHPTISGVLLGLLTPASAWIGDRTFLDVVRALPKKWKSEAESSAAKHRGNHVNLLIHAARETVPPLERLELALHPWVAFLIMPLFALANAGVPLAMEAVTTPVSVAVTLGLVLGKPAGILLFSWLAVRFAGARLPDRVNWKAVGGAGFLCGVGFTMSIFIAGLALDHELLVFGKVGTLMGSAISSIVGLGILFFVLPKRS